MKNQTFITREKAEKDFTVISNEVLKRSDLSWKAKGILAYIFSLPDDWKIYLEEVANHSTDGIKSFRSGWKELENAGYVKRYPIRDEHKIVAWETVVSEKADLLSHFVHVEKVEVQNVHVHNGTLLNTNSTKDLLEQNTNKESIVLLPYQQIIEYLNQRCDTNFKHTSKKTQDLIKARCNEGWELDDFKYVIDVKAEEWEQDEKYSQFLRPETLFSNKFEGYRNQKMKGAKNGQNNREDERYPLNLI